MSAVCPRCGKKRGRRSAKKYMQGVERARCSACKTEFWIWGGKGWLIPEHEEALKDALIAQMGSQLPHYSWWGAYTPHQRS